jgi:hypothetical protein
MMKEYKFLCFSELEHDGISKVPIGRFTDLLNANSQSGWEVVSHCADRYWGVTVIMGREKQ